MFYLQLSAIPSDSFNANDIFHGRETGDREIVRRIWFDIKESH